MTGFFKDYHLFQQAPAVSTDLQRLNWQYEAFIEDNVSIIKNQRVLDIASHDGRWSFAAHKAGANFVYGVEGRDTLLGLSYRNFDHYGIPITAYDFQKLNLDYERIGGSFDVALVLGFLYHTTNHYLILKNIINTGVGHLIIDTQIEPVSATTILFHPEDTFKSFGTSVTDDGTTIVGRPSFPALKLMLSNLGFKITKRYPWKKLKLPKSRCFDEYRNGERITFVASRQ